METTLNNFSTKSQICELIVWHLHECAAYSLIYDVLDGASFIIGVVCLPVCVTSNTGLSSSCRSEEGNFFFSLFKESHSFPTRFEILKF